MRDGALRRIGTGGLIGSLRRRVPTRESLLVGCSLAVLAAASTSAAAQGVPTGASPSAVDFDTPEYRADWGLAQINAATAYARGFTGLGVTVAVYDTGIDRNHPEFAGRISPDSRNFFLASDRTFIPDFVRDEQGHGTHVSGTIAAARDGTGTMGVAYDSTILSLYGIPPATYAWLTISDFGVDYPAAITHAAEKGARVYNGSYGWELTDPSYPIFQHYTFSYPDMLAEYNAMKRAVDSGTLFVFAAENNYEFQPVISQNPASPALLPYIKPSNAKSGVYQFYDIYRFIGDTIGHPIDQSQIDFSGVAGSVVAVVATDRDNTIASFSNRCGVTAAWCIAAPGVGILSTTPTDMGQPYSYKSGTSMAAPHVSGAAAVLMQAFPFLTAPQVAQTMFTTATHLGDGPADAPNATYGWGLLNLGKAIDGPGQFTSTWTVDTTYKGQAYDARFANAISGPGGLIKTGLGTLELAGTNSYAGGTAITGGTLAVSRDANLGAAGTGLTLGGGTLRILADGFSTARPITLDRIGGLRIDGGTATVAGVVADGARAGALVKTGAGAVLLSAANTFTGGTLVSDGALILTATGRLASPVLVNEGARFTNAGLASGGVRSGGTLVNDGTVLGGVINAGILSSSGTLSGRVANAGLLANSGVIAGAVSNGGTLATSGTIVGSLTNAGTTLNGGAIIGGVTNIGRLTTSGMIAGAVANAGSLANSVMISGGLTNTGTTRNDGMVIGSVANTGTLATTGTIAGGVTNAGLLLSSGTIAGTVANANILGNTGTINGAVSNAAAAALANIGTIDGGLSNAGQAFNTGLISGAVSNTGTLTTRGMIVGSLTNAGQAANSGTIAGGVSNTGVLATSGTLAGGLTNTGLALNGGAVTGGVSNAGTLATRGTLAGGLTNTGTVLASAGRIDGAIRNDAGTLAVTGTVASDGALANAAGATLAVTGAYSLAGPLANAGTVALAQNASLSAPAGLGNAGLLISDGSLTTDLTNTGTARLAGRLDGALTNTGSLLFTGPLAGLTSLTNAGPLDLGGTALTLASLSGPASGVIANGALTVTGSASTAYAGAILQSTSPTSLTKAGPGTLKLTGTGRFSGPTTIQAGTLSLDGVWTSPVTVASAGTLRGIGTVAAPVTVAGALRPGNSPGTLTVLGPVAFASGSRLGLDIDGAGTGTGAGSYARLLALGSGGAVAANGTLVPVLRGITGNATNSFTPALGQRFGVLTAQGGLSGAFTGLAQPGAGLAAGTRFDALYRPTGLDLVVTPAAYGDLAGLGLAQSGNAQAVGAALDAARPAAGTRPDAERARVFDALYAAGAATLPGGLASLSGQAYGDAVLADLAARRLVGDAIDRHLRGQGGGAAAFSAGDPGLGPNRSALQLRGAAGTPDQPLASGEGRVWADALYGFGSRAGDRAAAGADLGAGGLLVGVDRQVGADTLVGGAFGYLRETGTAKGQRQGPGFGLGRTTADSYGGTLYAGTRLGAVVLRGTAGLSHADGRIDRSVVLGSGVARASGLASGWDAGASGFAGYALGLGLPVELVPEMGFSVDRLTRARVAERGGLARQGFATADLTAARVLMGGRVASLALDGPTTDTAGLRLEGRAYWAHELADTVATTRSSLFGVPFATRTSALGRDGAVLGVSLTGPVAAGVQLSLSYTGDLRPGATAQVLSAGLQARW